MKKSFVFLANGFEEIEALVTVDVLRRAGIDTTTVSITDSQVVTGAHNIEVKADTTIANITCNAEDIIVLPGGMPGATNLAECATLTELLTAHNNAQGLIAAICASPAVVLAPIGVLSGKKATCYPGFEGAFTDCTKGETPVVVDGNVITGNGPATAIAFALAIVRKAVSEDKAQEVASGMLV